MKRICHTCFKEFNYHGKNCSSCHRKIRIEREKHLCCSKCGRNMLIMNKKFMLCNTCNRHKRESEIPGLKQKRTDEIRMYTRKYRGGDLNAPIRIRKGTWKSKSGYVLTFKYDHPNASPKGSLFVHTLIMSEYLGRPLEKHESVHHKNGIRDDNRIENLELWSKSQPAGQRLEDKIAWAIKFLNEYGYEIKSPNMI